MWARIVPVQGPWTANRGMVPARSGARRGLSLMLDFSNASSRPAAGAVLGIVHRRRLREVYRSAGWPCQDGIEVELLAAGLLQRERGPFGHETVRLTDAGIAVLAETLARNRARRDAHETLVERVAREMTR